MSSETLAPRVRLFIFEHFLEHAAPPVAEQAMARFSLSRAAARDALRDLEARGATAAKAVSEAAVESADVLGGQGTGAAGDGREPKCCFRDHHRRRRAV